MFLTIYKDKKTFSKYLEKIKEITLPLKNNLINYFLGRLRFEEYLDSINKLYEYEQTKEFGYLLLPFLSEMSFDEIKKHKHIHNLVIKLNKDKTDNEEESFKCIFESFNSCFECENFDFSKAFFGIISFVKQGTNNCFGTVYREYRSFWVGTLYLVDELNEIFNMRHPSLFNEFAVKYRRFSEFRGKMSKFR